MSEDFYYFGCVDQPGHYLWNVSMRWPKPSAFKGDGCAHGFRLGGKHLDTGFCPGVEVWPDGSTHDPGSVPEGQAIVHHVDGWTVLSFWDRSVDRRAGSHSTYVIRGTHGFDDVVRIARGAFPGVWSRYKFDVVPYTGPATTSRRC